MIDRTYSEQNAQKIIEFFRSKGLNDYAIAGFLSNWYSESFLRSDNAQNTYMNRFKTTDEEYTTQVDAGTWVRPDNNTTFKDDVIGYGLAQWTSKGRKAGLYEYAKSKGVSISDFNMQLEWAWKELTTGYPSLYKMLLEETNAHNAAVNIMVYYERPSTVNNLSVRDGRGKNAEEFYDIYFKKGNYTMTAKEFVDKLVDVANNYKTLYVLGCFGAPLNAKNKERYTNNQTYNGKPVDKYVGMVNGVPQYVKEMTAEGKQRKPMIMAATDDTFGFDCVCLIKGILWGWNGDKTRTYGGAGYAINNVPDVGANTMKTKYLQGVSTNFNNILVGEAVWMDGHIGVYIGNGQVVECTPKWENKVQITNLGNVGNKTGNYRMWTAHGRLPWIDYNAKVEDTYEPTPVTASEIGKRTYVVKKGDTLSKIAKEYNTTVDKIVKDNLKSHKSITANHIVTGWKLLV